MIMSNARRRQRPGAAMVETAFIALILFTFMFAIFEYGRYMMVRQVVDNAARAGARQAVTIATSYISSTTATSTVTATVTQNLAAQNLENLSIQIYQSNATGTNDSVTWSSTTFGGPIVVQIDGDLPLLFPTFGFLPLSGAAANSIHISTKVMMLFEAN